MVDPIQRGNTHKRDVDPPASFVLRGEVQLYEHSWKFFGQDGNLCQVKEHGNFSMGRKSEVGRNACINCQHGYWLSVFW